MTQPPDDVRQKDDPKERQSAQISHRCPGRVYQDGSLRMASVLPSILLPPHLVVHDGKALRQ